MKKYRVYFYKVETSKDGEDISKSLGNVEVFYDSMNKEGLSLSAVAFRRATVEQCAANSISWKRLS